MTMKSMILGLFMTNYHKPEVMHDIARASLRVGFFAWIAY